MVVVVGSIPRYFSLNSGSFRGFCKIMLIIQIHNDGTGNGVLANYDYSVYVNRDKIAEGRVENHNRLLGWEGLIQQLAKELEEKND